MPTSRKDFEAAARIVSYYQEAMSKKGTVNSWFVAQEVQNAFEMFFKEVSYSNFDLNKFREKVEELCPPNKTNS